MILPQFSGPLRRLGARWKSSIDKDHVRRLERSLDELSMRFSEFDHRVKNHTQLMLGILVSAERAASSAETRAVLNSVIQRMRAIVQVQAILRRAGDIGALRCDDFLGELCKAIRDASPYPFVLALESEPCELPSSAALPLGLILNELLTNAIKHGIGPNQGMVRVRLASLGNTLELRVEDNGRGFDDSDPDVRHSGLRMVQLLAGQLHGSFHARPGPGGLCIVRFQKPADKN